MTEALRVVIYAAKSTVDEHGSIADQIDECRQYAAAQGWIIDGQPESDEAASAWSGSRGGGLQRAMDRSEALAKRYGTAGLLVWKSNRLARGELVNEHEAKHLIDYWRWADKAKVRLLSKTDQPTFDNEIVLMLVGHLNAMDSRQKSDAVKRSTRKRRAAGRHVGGFVYGYVRDEAGNLVPDPHTAPIVQRIFRLVSQGTTQADVCRILNTEAVPTAKGGVWVQGSISAMLRRRTYLGEIPVDDPADRPDRAKDIPLEWGSGQHEPLVSQDIWDAVQAANARRAKRVGKGGGRPAKAGHLLTGHMLHHAVCGQAMTPRSGGARRDGTITGTYVCAGRKGGVCDGLTVPMEAVDEAVIGYLAEVGLDTEASLRLLRDSTDARREATTQELASARRDLARVQAERDHMWSLLKSKELDAEDWSTFKAEHAAAKAGLEAKITRLEAKAAADESAPVVVPAVADALSLVRDFIVRGDQKAIRNVIEALFSDFLIGEAVEPLEAPQGVRSSAHEVAQARAAIRAQIAAKEAQAGRTVTESNIAALEDEARQTIGPDVADDPNIAAGSGLFLFPEPRTDSLQSVMEPDGTAFLVDENGRNLFSRLPLQSTNAEGLTT